MDLDGVRMGIEPEGFIPPGELTVLTPPAPPVEQHVLLIKPSTRRLSSQVG